MSIHSISSAAGKGAVLHHAHQPHASPHQPHHQPTCLPPPPTTPPGGQHVIGASWTNFTDDDSGIVSFDVCIGSTAGAEDVLPCTNVGLSLAVAIRVPAANATSRRTPQAFYTTVVAHDRAGNTRQATSAGLLLLPPTAVAWVSPAGEAGSAARLMQVNCTQFRLEVDVPQVDGRCQENNFASPSFSWSLCPTQSSCALENVNINADAAQVCFATIRLAPSPKRTP